MKKIKKIILSIIVAVITLISVFSCFKGNYTPEPILTPVSVLKPAKSTNDNIINPTGTYDTIYLNTSIDYSELEVLAANLNFNEEGGYFVFVNLDIFSIYIYDTGEFYGLIFTFEGFEYPVLTPEGWNTEINNPFILNQSVTGSESLGEVIIGQQNNLLTNLISPVPFLFEGTSDSIAWTSSGLDNPNNIQNIYFNTNLTNQAIKNALDTYIGDTSGIDIFSYLDTGVKVRCHVINNNANAFIQVIGGSTIIYKWIYDSIDTDETIWWYGIDPAIIDNGNVLISPNGNALEGFNIYELRCLFSSSNDFTETSSGDSYEQGYQDGYTAGETAGYNQGYTEGQTAGYNQGYTAGETAGQTAGYNQGYTAGETAGYNQGYTSGQTAGYNQGYLDGLDDGAGSNVNYQYIESVLTLIGNFLNIEILPNIKLSYALGIIIILSIISIIKMVVK